MPIVEIPGIGPVEWPSCAVADCENLTCLGAGSETVCYQHLSPADRAQYDELLKKLG
jgi:hypothetical protein